MLKKTLTLMAALCLLLALSVPAGAELRGFSGDYQYVQLGAYPQDESGAAQPVVWRVLSVSAGKALLLSEYILDVQQAVYQPVENGPAERPASYEETWLYSWMNTTMAQALFEGEEALFAALVNTGRGRVYPLSSQELLDSGLGFSANEFGVVKQRQALPTAYARSQRVYSWSKALYMDSDYRSSPYWTSDFSANSAGMMRIVAYDGHLSDGAIARANIGVRPAVTLDLSQCELVSGSGTLQDPFCYRSLAAAVAIPTPAPTLVEVTEAPLTEIIALPEGTAEAEEEPLEGEELTGEEEVPPEFTLIPTVEVEDPSLTPPPGREEYDGWPFDYMMDEDYDYGDENARQAPQRQDASPASSVTAVPTAPAASAAPASAAPALVTTAVQQTATPLPSPTATPAPVITAEPPLAVWTQEMGEPVDSLTLSLLGDVSIGDAVQFTENELSLTSTVRKNGYAWPFSTVKEFLSADDFTLANLEAVLTAHTELAQVEKYSLIAPPDFVNVLSEGSVEVVGTVNDHSLRFGDEGYADTINALHGAGLRYFGTIRLQSGETSDIVRILQAKNCRIGLVGFSYPTQEDLTAIAERMKLLRDNGCQLVIVSLHWGRETHMVAEDSQFAYARQLIDLGADVIWGHHPHVLQPIYFYRGRPILFSTGNFIFGTLGNVDTSSAIIQLRYDLDAEGNAALSALSAVPLETTRGGDYRPRVLTEKKEKEACLMKLLSRRAVPGFTCVPVAFAETGALSVGRDGTLTVN